ncbi:iron uptake system protein EfeO [Aeromicrobium sp. 179-A 4D2 NHS]|uniref:iron uptake system protein EfeO n=1 Tax=Aeromicrobium sp. 179-A 4D2 NHS TaxID=3142375 RepID=UPI00399FFE38
MNRRTRPIALAVAVTASLALSACVKNSDSDDAGIEVTSTADSCEVSAAKAESGTLTFDVTNDGSKVTEFYLLDSDQLRIVGEVENIAPGTSRTLTVQAQPGEYYTECKPGMVGDGVGNAKFTVTGDEVALDQDEQQAFDAAVDSYTAYTKDQVGTLVTQVRKFVDAYVAGDDEKARALFPIARINYERIEPTAEQFGDLDPKIDYRKPGAEAENLPFTGFHRIEMDLWLDEARKNYPGEKLTALEEAGRRQVGEQLVTDIEALYDKVHSDAFVLEIGNITNGAIGLLDEVASPDGKLPGEEDEFSHTDLYDFYANVEGSKVAYESVRDIAEAKGAEGKQLVEQLDEQFAAMFALLEKYGSYEDDFVSYDTVKQPQRNELGAQLNALSEPLSQLTDAVLGGSAS